MQNKKTTAIKAAGVLLSCVLMLPVNVYAAPKTMADGQIFDAEYYAATYPDVAQALGTDESALYQHYQTYGKNEGRKAYDAATLANAEKKITNKILSLKSKYPEGMTWTNDNVYRNDVAAPHTKFMGCAAFAMQLSDEVYGTTTPMITLQPKTIDELRPGDIVRIFNGTHTVLVLSVDSQGITVCEGNYGGTVHWNDRYTRNELDGQITYVNRRVQAGEVKQAAKTTPTLARN